MHIGFVFLALVFGCSQNDELTQSLKKHLSEAQTEGIKAENLLKKSSEALKDGKFEIALEILNRVHNVGQSHRFDKLKSTILCDNFERL